MLVFKLHIGILRSFEGLEGIDAQITAEGLEETYKKLVLD